MIEIRDKTIVIDGRPRLLISGEVHYFRLPRDTWRDRLEKLKAAGCNTVASYIPWLCHEPERGNFDLDGHTRSQLDLAAFIDLCQEMDLFFIARPGPFIMAEMKNEGIPYYLYENHPEIIPVGWDGKPAPTRTVDYLAPAFLAETRRWYDAVMPIIAARLQPDGGNIIAVQLDNEIGMLSWVSNSPDLTDPVIDDFWSWLGATLGEPERGRRYPFAEDELAASVRSPREDWAGVLMQDLGQYMRTRFARYIATLRAFAEENGVQGVPFIVNIHGTEAGGGAPYPIGISQLFETWQQDAGYLAGSDHYLGNLTAGNAPDWYLMNAVQEAMNLPDQPLTSMEFEAGSGDYGESMGARLDPSAADFKLRMAITQGNRLVNYYLFTGGFNYRMDRETGDGNDRISFTGERHGTGAPVSPEGVLNYTWPRLARTDKMLLALESHLATAREEHDGITMALVPDYFMTESVYHASSTMTNIADALKRTRFGGPGAGMIRAMMQLTLRYPALDIQHHNLDVRTVPVLTFASARYLSKDLQEKLVSYVRSGGRLLLHGEIPTHDMTGQPCLVLAEALGLNPIGFRQSDHRYFLSMNAGLWAAPRAEWRASWAQTFSPKPGATLLHVYGADEAAGFDIRMGAGRVIAITADIPVDVAFWAETFCQLGVVPGLQHTSPDNNIWLSSVRNDSGERFVHALNLDGFDKSAQILHNGHPLFDGQEVTLRQRDGVLLPLGVDLGDARLIYATVEMIARDTSSLMFRLTGPQDVVCLETERPIIEADGTQIERDGKRILVRSTVPGTGHETMRIQFGA